MSNSFIESLEGLRYEERISIPLRFFVGFIGMGMFVIPVPFLLNIHLGLPTWQLLLAALCVLAPSFVGVLFLCIALGRCLHLYFDTPRRIMLRGSRWPLGSRWTVISYVDVDSPSLQKRSSEDGPYYIILLGIRGERAMQLGSFSSRDEAEQWRNRIAVQFNHVIS